MIFDEKVFVARNCTATQIAIQFVVGTFYRFFRAVLKYGLKF